MSPYLKASIFVGTAPLLVIALMLVLGVIGLWSLLIYAFAPAFWLRCPKCDDSLFMRKGGMLDYSLPWPEKRCSNCGRDLTAV